MFKRLRLFLLICISAAVYIYVNRCIAGIWQWWYTEPDPNAASLWAVTIALIALITPFALAVAAGATIFGLYIVGAPIFWIIKGEFPESPLDMFKQIIRRKSTSITHEQYVQRYKAEAEESKIMKELNAEYPGMEE